jgi:hypothetical protein
VAGFAVLGVTFSRYRKLASARGEAKFRLPKYLHAGMECDIERVSSRSFSGFHVDELLSLKEHQAYFINSHELEFFGKACNDPKKADRAKSFSVKFTPHINSFTYNTQMETVRQLCSPRNSRHHAFLLNQVHDAMVDIDMTKDSPVSEEAKRRADEELLEFMAWNEEQLQVIRGVKAAKDGKLIIMGPAGTGKTLLQEALAIYFWRLGFHIIALAPANSNADHLIGLMVKLRVSGLRCYRLYPNSRDMGPENLTQEAAQHRRVGHNEGNATSVHDLELLLHKLEERENQKANARDYDVEHDVIHEARKKELKMMKTPRMWNEYDQRFTYSAAPVDIWQAFRDSLEVVQKNQRAKQAWIKQQKDTRQPKTLSKPSPLTPSEKSKLDWAYRQCKAHIISETRVMVTTTGNVRSSDLMQPFGKDMDGNDNCKGMIVFVDEACEEIEQLVWAGVVWEPWADKVKGFIMLGDDK